MSTSRPGSTPLTRDEIILTLGDLDDLTVAELLSLGASSEEFHAALRLLAADTEVPDPTTLPPVTVDLMKALQDLDADALEPEYLGTD
jgi:hypothetical protein